jgi:hypothetical protein
MRAISNDKIIYAGDGPKLLILVPLTSLDLQALIILKVAIDFWQ